MRLNAAAARRCSSASSIIGRGPAGGVLLVERDKFAVACDARSMAGFTVEHERKQAERLGFGGHQLNQRSPNGDGVERKGVVR